MNFFKVIILGVVLGVLRKSRKPESGETMKARKIVDKVLRLFNRDTTDFWVDDDTIECVYVICGENQCGQCLVWARLHITKSYKRIRIECQPGIPHNFFTIARLVRDELSQKGFDSSLHESYAQPTSNEHIVVA
jgi:hypothetical protein